MARPRSSVRGAAGIAALGLLILSGLAGPSQVAAQGPSAARKEAPAGAIEPVAVDEAAEVESLYVSGLRRVDSMLVVRKLGVRPGERPTMEHIRKGVHNLFDLGYFSDVELLADSLEDGSTILTLKLVERPAVAFVEFQGNSKGEITKLQSALGVSVGQWVDEAMIPGAESRVRDYYRGEGYGNARVTITMTPLNRTLSAQDLLREEEEENRKLHPGEEPPSGADGSPGAPPDHNRTPEAAPPKRGAAAGARALLGAQAVKLGVEIVEGDKLKVDAVHFTGNGAFTSKELAGQIKTRPRGFLRSGTYKPEETEEDLKGVGAWYRDHGYRQVAVTGPEVKTDSTGRFVTLTYAVDEGPVDHFGSVRWSGSTVFPDSVLRRIERHQEGGVYRESLIQKTLEDIYGAYQERGYIFVEVDPRLLPHDGVVDLVYEVHEGQLAHLREVKVAGNLHTKDKVIRRQVVMRQGDVFRRSGLQRSQRDIFALGIFQDVQIETQPVEGSAAGDVDLLFKVQEKQIGTASGGAGYSGQSGLTGFIDLGHKNIFGGGQAANLHLERGNNVSNYFLSYTEPYWKDTPTTVGFELFNTFQNRLNASVSTIASYYDTKRAGGSLTMGRPVGFVDYSRISVTYRLENVTLTNFIDSLICKSGGTVASCAPESLIANPLYDQNLRVLQGQKWPQLTSSLSATFSRNSTDNPFYPTRGSVISYRLGVTGGLLGGAVSFNKHLLDVRRYQPLKGALTFMDRHRIGILAGNRSGDRVPLYELFRAGGTAENSLRGYPDYFVVPAGNLSTAGGKWMLTNSFELQFPVVSPAHAVLFVDAGNVWNGWSDVTGAFRFKTSAGVGLRMEVPFLGPIGFDYAYGFGRSKWTPHILFGGQF